MLTQLMVWLNRVASSVAAVILAPIAWLPGWLSATIIAVVTGIVMLIVFKYTSNQTAIKHTRSRIKANLLALSLFRDDLWVGLRCQGALLLGAGRLLALSLVPMLVMLVPMGLVLGQLALWYQARPVSVGEAAVVSVHLAANQHEHGTSPEVQLAPSSAITASIGPVRVLTKHMICWNVSATEPGCHELRFDIGDRSFTKELAVGAGFMPTSLKRPEWSFLEVMLHPREEPFSNDSPVNSIEVDYPQRSSWTSGTNSWLIYWLLVSMVAAFAVRPLLKVNI